MRRPFLVALLSLGVVFGYGSAIARASWHARHGGEGCHGWQSRYDRDRYDRDEAPIAPAAAPAPAPAPQTVVVQSPAAPAPVYIVIPQGAAPLQPQTIVLQPSVRTEPVEVRPAAAPVAPATNPTAAQ